MTRVKICGIRRVEDAIVAAKAGADMLGFVFAESPRRIDPVEAREIIEQVRTIAEVLMVGVFVDASVGEIEEIAGLCGLDYAQLSGHENESVAGKLAMPAIKVVHVDERVTEEELEGQIEAAGTDIVLLDTKHDHLFGGTGESFDWGVIPRGKNHLLLAGGLRPENVAEAVRVAAPWGVDVSSGVESGGQKDQGKIEAFVRAVRLADQGLIGG